MVSLFFGKELDDQSLHICSGTLLPVIKAAASSYLEKCRLEAIV